jgi:hypothetical protein
MPPKKKDTADGADGAAPGTLLQGFTDKETKLLAAAFLSSIGPDKVSLGHSRGVVSPPSCAHHADVQPVQLR